MAKAEPKAPTLTQIIFQRKKAVAIARDYIEHHVAQVRTRELEALVLEGLDIIQGLEHMLEPEHQDHIRERILELEFSLTDAGIAQATEELERMRAEVDKIKLELAALQQ